MNQKNNQRFKETDQRIQAYFLKLLEEKNISKITVNEICTGVGINRSSFYLHYQDVYALLEAVCFTVGRELFLDIEAAQIDAAVPYFATEYLLVILYHVRRHRKLYRAYVENVGMTQIDAGYDTLLETVFKPYFRKLGMESERRMEYHFSYVKAGFFAVLGKWMEYGCAESPEELAEILKQSMPSLPDSLPGMDGI